MLVTEPDTLNHNFKLAKQMKKTLIFMSLYFRAYSHTTHYNQSLTLRDSLI